MMLSKIPPDVDGRMSYVYDGATTFHYIVDSGITYLCMSSEMVKRRIPFAFLEDVKTRFKQQVRLNRGDDEGECEGKRQDKTVTGL